MIRRMAYLRIQSSYYKAHIIRKNAGCKVLITAGVYEGNASPLMLSETGYATLLTLPQGCLQSLQVESPSTTC